MSLALMSGCKRGKQTTITTRAQINANDASRHGRSPHLLELSLISIWFHIQELVELGIVSLRLLLAAAPHSTHPRHATHALESRRHTAPREELRTTREPTTTRESTASLPAKKTRALEFLG